MNTNQKTNQKKMEKSFILRKTETGRKAARFNYEIIDNNGEIISTRQSNREYCAATICGSFYFGRHDLINKGDHRNSIKRLTEMIENQSIPVFQIENAKKRLSDLKNIAILEGSDERFSSIKVI